MIKYSLICEKEHDFEAWFSSSKSFDDQQGSNLVSCPICNSSKINKTLMTPSISTSKTKAVLPALPVQDPLQNQPAKEALVTSPAAIPSVPSPPPGFDEFITKVRQMRQHIVVNSEDVGNKFPDEARKIHYGETKKRSIYGQASSQDVKELVDEGVEVMAMPHLPEDNN